MSNAMLASLSLENRTAIVTGGGTGLGRAMVISLAKAGANVVVAARRQPLIHAAADEVRGLGRRALAIPTDVTKSTQVKHMVEEVVAEFGKVDILINNAGIVRDQRLKPIWEITDKEWSIGLDVNLTGAFYCSRAVAGDMVTRGHGKIINIASGFGFRGGRDNYMYATAKGGIVNLTRVLATSLSRYGVTATCIVPGFIPTEGAPAGQEGLPQSRFIPVGRSGLPSEIGPLAVYLASDASSYTNGGFFCLDGGGLAGGSAPTGYAPEIPLEI